VIADNDHFVVIIGKGDFSSNSEGPINVDKQLGNSLIGRLSCRH
jgi:hypothetical protein